MQWGGHSPPSLLEIAAGEMPAGISPCIRRPNTPLPVFIPTGDVLRILDMAARPAV
jgi:hypothetical protein